MYLRVEPLPRGSGFEFVDQVKGGTIPNQFIPAVQKGVEQVLAAGPIAGFPLQDVRVIVYDGKHHAVDSKEIAFVTAGRKAFLDAIEKARPIVLEPIVSLEVLCPEANMGDVAGDLSGRRGQVTGTRSLQAGTLTVNGLAPLSELDGYAARLKAMTAGHAGWTMTLSHYDPAPPNLSSSSPPSSPSTAATKKSRAAPRGLAGRVMRAWPDAICARAGRSLQLPPWAIPGSV